MIDDPDLCPKCQAGHVKQGYGMAGGGMGFYEYCDNEACDYFDKTQDVAYDEPESPSDPSVEGG